MKKLSCITFIIFCKFALAIPIYFTVRNGSNEIMSTVIINNKVCSYKHGQLQHGQNTWIACQGLTNLDSNDKIKAIYQLDHDGQTIELATTEGHIYHSVNDGLNWTYFNKIYLASDQHVVTALKSSKSDSVFYILNNAEVFKLNSFTVEKYCQPNVSYEINSAVLNPIDDKIFMAGRLKNKPEGVGDVFVCEPSLKQSVSTVHPLGGISHGNLFIVPLFDLGNVNNVEDYFCVLSDDEIFLVGKSKSGSYVSMPYKINSEDKLHNLHGVAVLNLSKEADLSKIYITAEGFNKTHGYFVFDVKRKQIINWSSPNNKEFFSGVYFDYNLTLNSSFLGKLIFFSTDGFKYSIYDQMKMQSGVPYHDGTYTYVP